MNGDLAAEMAAHRPMSLDDAMDALMAPSPGRTHANAHGSELIAAQVMKVTGSRVRLLVLADLADAGDDGRTDAEMERSLDLPRPTPGNRRGDLVAVYLAEKAHQKRPHPVTKNPCEVWRITVAGRRLVDFLGGTQAVRRLAANT